jgi:hypothetical protein
MKNKPKKKAGELNYGSKCAKKAAKVLQGPRK